MANWYFNPEFTGEKLVEWMKKRKNRMVQRAKFAAFFRKDFVRLNQIIEAADCVEAENLDEWRTQAKLYPDDPLKKIDGPKIKKRNTRLTGSDVSIRSYILDLYMQKILDLIDAPEKIKSDLSLLLNDYVPQSAHVAEKIQRAFLDNPEYANNISQMASDIGVHRATIQDLIANAIVVSPADRHRRGPWPVGEMAVRRNVEEADD